MLRPLPFANALGLVMIVIHTLGLFLSLLAPGAYWRLWELWMFMDLSSTPTGGAGLTPGGFLLGLTTTTLLVWLGGLAGAWLYNRMAGPHV